MFDLAAARLDRDPEPKIGHIAMALERRGEPTERGNLWRAVVTRNLDRFSAWIALRTRLEELWGKRRGRMGETVKSFNALRIRGKPSDQGSRPSSATGCSEYDGQKKAR